MLPAFYIYTYLSKNTTASRISTTHDTTIITRPAAQTHTTRRNESSKAPIARRAPHILHSSPNDLDTINSTIAHPEPPTYPPTRPPARQQDKCRPPADGDVYTSGNGLNPATADEPIP
ncbi:uncharacterized protein H6S33_002568 [Morchella sextelata]|uniref:uncharacterized protein n=1 Tax=Morchella sextelata TaxID=1174677 RepID=UPI001D048945|nr:uncharacterized protein H6S33_002568 [Morchella sextelata]KAH0607534.1 hypothetical protein H6S33_002568 [Morchella sextelata]